MSAGRVQTEPLLQVVDLKMHFPVKRRVGSDGPRWLKAVDGVSFELDAGRTLGLVGESGCGKSTLARTILRLVPATGGSVRVAGRDLAAVSRAELRRLRRTMQIVFQDPIGSLNPRLSVETIVGEALGVHGIVADRQQRRQRVAELLRRVGLRPEDMARYPHAFSGGQRQRIGIARALALEPKLLICDEPVSALDVSVQAQILNLLVELQAEMGLAYLFIAHDLNVVRHISDDVAVMYLGRIVEQASTEMLYGNPRHPYTRVLLRAATTHDLGGNGEGGPRGDGDVGLGGHGTVALRGEPPSPLDPPSGCPFHPRCPLAVEMCRAVRPELIRHPGLDPAHRVACHRAMDG